MLTTRIVTMEKDDDEDEYDDVQYNEDEEVEGEEDQYVGDDEGDQDRER